ncbi:sarcosine oxidase subunit gamma [Novosphingobium sp.]|uniref:sarcosine oxidase subunit gamma n=1 Tax=Novosphingobium sp. TaxID=1874826 RepID=UPI002636A0E6|nr:sarcosine oxidase subunit gamma family protein [Novosphingobium sp.]
MDDAVTLEMQSGFGLATVMARKSATDADLAALPDIPFAAPGRCTGDTGLTTISIGPRAWLAFAGSGESQFAADLANALAGNASVSDQSGGYVIFKIGGAKARKLLQRGVPIDLHPAAFPQGSAATTVIAHIGVVLWQGDADDAFNLAVFRSYAASFEHWFRTVAASL